jgi:hypothetical protein
MKLVLRIIPGFLGAFNVLGIYLFVKSLTKEEEVATISAFFLAINPFHSYTTKIATPEGLALGLLFFSLYSLLENKTLIAGIIGGFILLTDYLIFGHFIIILIIYLATNFNKKNIRHLTFILILTFIIALPWQIYLSSISIKSSFAGNVGAVSPPGFLALNPDVIADTLHFLPSAITPLHAIFIIGGLFFARKKKYFRFISLILISFFILSFANTKSLGAPPLRHIISLSIFSSIISAVCLDGLKTKKLLFSILILFSILSYFSFPLDFFVEIPKETVDANNWLNEESPPNIHVSAPSPVYAVLSGKTIIYENSPCTNKAIDYVVDDRNFEKWPTSYKGKPLEILNYSCLDLVYKSRNVYIYRVA